MLNTCPNCAESKYLYSARSWCANCGWHDKGAWIHHADFEPDWDCRWCQLEGANP